ncbi:hypothetical protein [Orrella sp. 11846]|uniref:hypothetical protein n=1 Tax=Orrella sp. 11846 TaxID=3409913 RepID=UPI003B5ACAD1
MQVQKIETITRERAIDLLRIEQSENYSLRQKIIRLKEDMDAVGAGGVSGCQRCTVLTYEHNQLREALKALIKGYVSTLENALDRIVQIEGVKDGVCMSLDDMLANDPHIAAATKALAENRMRE